uniref:Uncharacterized protein n=1 Tax=Rhizophora mucronata TaxID=61149 RepID=A0A2P2QZL0_RHIMU
MSSTILQIQHYSREITSACREPQTEHERSNSSNKSRIKKAFRVMKS